MRSRGVVAALVVLGALHLLAAASGFVAPYHFATQHRAYPFAPPTVVRWVDETGSLRWPFVYRSERVGLDEPVYREVRDRRYPLRFFIRGEAYELGGLVRSDLHLFGVEGEARVFLMGTDGLGRDQLARLLTGAAVSLTAGLLAAALALANGVLLGVASGYFGGWVDSLFMRLGDLLLAVPWLYLLLAIRAALPLELSAPGSMLTVVGVVGAVGWVRTGRLVRGTVMSTLQRDFVLAARAVGVSGPRLLLRHVVPQSSGVIAVQAALLVPAFVAAETTLSFLGLGVSEPVPSLGTLLAGLREFEVLELYWWLYAPAFLLALVGGLFHVVARALSEHSLPLSR